MILKSVIACFLLGLLIRMAWVDVKTGTISYGNLLLLAMGIALSSTQGSFPDPKKTFLNQLEGGIWSGACLWTGVAYLKKRIGTQPIGSGDIPILVMLSFYLGLDHTPFFLFLCGFFGTIGYLMHPSCRRQIPFMPAITMAFFVILCVILKEQYF